jgi:hypothetical protein
LPWADLPGTFGANTFGGWDAHFARALASTGEDASATRLASRSSDFHPAANFFGMPCY